MLFKWPKYTLFQRHFPSLHHSVYHTQSPPNSWRQAVYYFHTDMHPFACTTYGALYTSEQEFGEAGLQISPSFIKPSSVETFDRHCDMCMPPLVQFKGSQTTRSAHRREGYDIVSSPSSGTQILISPIHRLRLDCLSKFLDFCRSGASQKKISMPI